MGFLKIIHSSWNVLKREKVRFFSLFFIAVIIFCGSLILADNSGNSFSVLFLNISAEFIGAIVIFILLEYGIDRIERLRSGIEEFDELPIEKYKESVAKAKAQVLILDTYLYSLMYDYKNSTDFTQRLQSAIEHSNAEVKILILDPESDAAKQRAEDLNGQEDYMEIIKEMRICLGHLKSFYHYVEKAHPNYVENNPMVRVYDSLPAFSLYSWDNFAFWNFHPIKKKSTSSTLLQIPLNLEIGSFLKRKFDEVWDDSTTISIVDYEDTNSASSDSHT